MRIAAALLGLCIGLATEGAAAQSPYWTNGVPLATPPLTGIERFPADTYAASGLQQEGIELSQVQGYMLVTPGSWTAVQSFAAGDLHAASPVFSGTVSGSNTVPFSILAQAGANTVLGNFSSGTANVSGQPVPSCSGAGQFLNYLSGSGFDCPSYTEFYSDLGNSPAGTAATSYVMMGLGNNGVNSWRVTPATTGRVEFSYWGYCSNTNAGDLSLLLQNYGTGVAPSNGDPTTGTAVPVLGTRFSSAAGLPVPCSGSVDITGLAAISYWFDLSLESSSAGNTGSVVVTSVRIKEY